MDVPGGSGTIIQSRGDVKINQVDKNTVFLIAFLGFLAFLLIFQLMLSKTARPPEENTISSSISNRLSEINPLLKQTTAPPPTDTPTYTDTPTPTDKPTDTPTYTPTFTPAFIPILERQICNIPLYKSPAKSLKKCQYSRINVGDVVYVLPGNEPVCIRPPNDSTIRNCFGNAADGESMLVIYGPLCTDEWLFWKVVTESGIAGWAPEGDNQGGFFLKPFCTESVCPKTRSPFFKVGDFALHPDWGSNQKIRVEPTLDSSQSGTLYKDQVVELIQGPICSDNLVWWNVKVVDTEETGWIAEGDSDTYWIIPYTGNYYPQ